MRLRSREDRAQQTQALVQRYLNREFTESVLSASLKCLGYYPDEIHEIVFDANISKLGELHVPTRIAPRL